MPNYKNIIRLIIGSMLSLIVVSNSFATSTIITFQCFATSPGPIVDMRAYPSIESPEVNTLSVDNVYPIIALEKRPSELEPEGSNILWLLLHPVDGSPDGWVMYSEVSVFGAQCKKWGL